MYIGGNKKMDNIFRLEKKDDFRIIGYQLSTTNKKKEGRKKIPVFWNDFFTSDMQDNLLPLMNQTPMGVFGISFYNTDAEDARKFEYCIGVSSDIIADHLTSYTIQAHLWAVFPCTKETIAKTEVQAITKWLPKAKLKPLNKGYISGRMKSGAPDIEYYGEDGNVEIWIAVQE